MRVPWLLVGLLALPAPARAQQPPPPDTSEQRLRELEQQNKELHERLQKLEQEQQELHEKVDRLTPLAGRITGYLDFGFFAVDGDGSGLRTDEGNLIFPEYSYAGQWVFMGDPLATAINSRGEPADTRDSRAVTFNQIGNGGKPSFILNALSVALFGAIGEQLTLNAIIDFVPRSRNVSIKSDQFLGDFIDVKLAYAEWIVPTQSFALSLYAGKLDPVLGYEYRIQESPDRIGIAPSLLCRYICGRPLGLKARAKLWDDALIFALAVTNGSSFQELFPFYDEIDVNIFKTVSGRLSYRFPIGAGFEIGASGALGAQDFQTDDAVYQWHVGVDAHLDWQDLDLSAEYVRGRAEGKSSGASMSAPCDLAPCLRYEAAYGQIAYRWYNWLTPYVRVDWRDALHRDGASFVYISQLARVTGGLHFELGTSVIFKAEYTTIRELGRIPEFADDVFTSSLVIKF